MNTEKGNHMRSKVDSSCVDDGCVGRKMKTGSADESQINKSRIYNYGYRKKPAELFRKDLISSMKLADSEQLNRQDYLRITDGWKEEWEKGVQVPVNAESMPKPTSKLRKDRVSKETNFKLPKKLIKNDPDADSYVSKYELDLNDYCWLEAMKGSQELLILPDTLVEDVINEFEHQCAKNMKAKHVGIEYDDHIICDVCRSPDAEDGNEMVFCDCCNICVHQACYGIVDIPDGEWICRPCKEFGSQTNVSCALCPNIGGALKPTTTSSQWAHVSCALWIPEVSFGCVNDMEPITKIKNIPQSRWNLICNFCDIKKGAPIQCSVKTCKVGYHVTCAFTHKLKMKAIVEEGGKGVKLKSFCKKHTDQDLETPMTEVSGEGNPNLREIEIATLDETAESNRHFWKYININDVHHHFLPVLQAKYTHLSNQTLIMYIDVILQYWKLKRSAHYGAPLIKVVTTASLQEMQMQERMDILRLRVDLERIRNLSYMLCRREKIKRNWLRTHQSTVETGMKFATGVVSYSKSTQEAKYNHATEENIQLVKEIFTLNNIYDNTDNIIEKLKLKRVLKQLERLRKIDSLKRNRTNPYAKYYLGGKRRLDDEPVIPLSKLSPSKIPSPLRINGYTKSSSPLSFPLRNRSVQAGINGIHNHLEIEVKGNEQSFHSVNNKSTKNQNHKRPLVEYPSPECIIGKAPSLAGYKIPKKKRLMDGNQDVESDHTFIDYNASDNDRRISSQSSRKNLEKPHVQENNSAPEIFNRPNDRRSLLQESGCNNNNRRSQKPRIYSRLRHSGVNESKGVIILDHDLLASAAHDIDMRGNMFTHNLLDRA